MIRRYFQWFMILIALLILAAVFTFNKWKIQDQATGPATEQTENTNSPSSAGKPVQNGSEDTAEPPKVTVINISSARYEAQVSAFGAAHAQYELTLKAQITGQIIAISPKFDNGLRLDENDKLLTVDDSDYRAALADAKANLAEAKLNLLEIERKAIQAKAEWQAMGLKGKPDSTLVLYEPQLTVAKSVVARTQAKLVSAHRDQKNTRIVAPFNALVAERLVAPGSYVQMGSDVATLYSSERIEIALALPSSDWLNLPDPETLIQGNWPVELISVEEGESWQGRVSRMEQHLDATTRQRTLIVAVEQPLDQSPALFPGTFLQAKIKGRKVDQLWKLPNSALSQRSEIWYLNEDNTLNSFATQALFSDAESIYIPVPASLIAKPQYVLISPLNSYLQGMAVSPVEQSLTSGSLHE